MLFNKEALVLRCKIVAPLAWELKLLAVLDSLLQNAYALSVGQTNEVGVQYALKTLDKSLVNHLVEELEVVLAVLQCPTDAVLDEVFLKIHKTCEVEESHLRLNHPELCQVARSVGILGTESRTECVDGSKCSGTKLAFELTRHSQRCLLAEEVVAIVNLAILSLLQIVEILGCYLEHLACTLAVAGCDERCMEVEIAVLVEVCVDGHSHIVAYTHNGTERIGAQTQVGVLSHVLKRLTLLLHRIVAATESVYLNALTLYL